MDPAKSFILCCLILIELLLGISQCRVLKDPEIFAKTKDIISRRGYIARDHYFITPDGYIINMIRVLNPLINMGESGLYNKKPVLFLHGTVVDSKYFIINSRNARPKNYAHLKASEMDPIALEEMLIDDPASKSLATTLLNFGHEVWFLNQRGTPESLGHINRPNHLSASYNAHFRNVHDSSLLALSLTKVLLTGNIDTYLSSIMENNPNKLFGSDYWNFSNDEHACIDLPIAIDYILKHTNQDKLSVVSHSQGGAVILMALANDPNLSSKISRNLLWAPSLYPTSMRNLITAKLVQRFLRKYTGPIPPPFILPAMISLYATICKLDCEDYVNTFGYGGHQLDTEPAFIASFMSIASSHTLNQLLDAAVSGKMCRYDFGDSAKNMAAYNQVEPPEYDFSQIRSGNISLWAGAPDKLTPIDTVVKIAENLGVQADVRIIKRKGIYFNHLSFLIHHNIAELLIIPGLRYLES